MNHATLQKTTKAEFTVEAIFRCGSRGKAGLIQLCRNAALYSIVVRQEQRAASPAKRIYLKDLLLRFHFALLLLQIGLLDNLQVCLLSIVI